MWNIFILNLYGNVLTLIANFVFQLYFFHVPSHHAPPTPVIPVNSTTPAAHAQHVKSVENTPQTEAVAGANTMKKSALSSSQQQKSSLKTNKVKSQSVEVDGGKGPEYQLPDIPSASDNKEQAVQAKPKAAVGGKSTAQGNKASSGIAAELPSLPDIPAAA